MNILPILAIVAPAGLMHFLGVLFVIVFICALLALAVFRSPLTPGWKEVLNWLLIVIPIAYTVLYLLSFV